MALGDLQAGSKPTYIQTRGTAKGQLWHWTDSPEQRTDGTKLHAGAARRTQSRRLL